MKRYLFLSLLLTLLIGCGPNATDEVTDDVTSTQLTNVLKFSENDPFKNSLTESEFFEIDPTKDNVIEGNEGTIVVAPQGCFLDGKGNPVTENIQIELTECLRIEEMVLSNLTTTANGKPLETDGMIYINATANGEQLSIDKDNPIYIEIPTDEMIDGMQAYKGTRDTEGNMDWTDPKDLENYLTVIDLKLLDFLPTGFGEAVQGGMPFRNYETATEALIDSLYYSLSVSDGTFLTQGFQATDYNEPYNQDNEVVDGKYTDASYTTNSDYYTMSSHVDDTMDSLVERECGVDPAKIKVLKSAEFQNTLIATKEFESRLKVIFSTCQTDLVELYVDNAEKNLWEIDQMVADRLTDDKINQTKFSAFAQQKKTNVQGSKKYSAALKTFYETELKQFKESLEAVKEKVRQELQAKNEVAKKVADEYKALLFKRETFRMQKYGLEWSETGWLNIDKGTLPKTWGPQKLELFVEKGSSYDRVYAYVIYTSLKSLYRMNTNEGDVFFVGNSTDRSMLMPERKMAVVLTVAYNGDIPHIGLQEFTTGDPKVEVVLKKSSIAELKALLKPYDNYKAENKIDVDLEYMAFFAKEKERQNTLRSEQRFIKGLRLVAFPCCGVYFGSISEDDEVYPTLQ